MCTHSTGSYVYPTAAAVTYASPSYRRLPLVARATQTFNEELTVCVEDDLLVA